MKKILPYKLNLLPVEKLQLPVGAQILTILDFNGEPTLFAVVDPEQVEKEERVVKMAATGKEFDLGGFSHIGSFPVANYGIVYHFFGDVPEEPETKAPVAEVEVRVEKTPPTDWSENEERS